MYCFRRGELAIVPCRNGKTTAEVLKSHLVSICKERGSSLKGKKKLSSYEQRQTEFIKHVSEFGIKIIESEIKDFKDGEISIALNESVRGKDVYVIQNTLNPEKPEETSKNIMELLLMLDAVQRADAAHVTVIMPYFSYCKQERRQGRQPISTKLLIDIMEKAGAECLITMDLHAPATEGSVAAKDFRIQNLFASPMLIDYLMNEKKFDGVYVAPDPGAGKMVTYYAKVTNSPMALGYKQRDPRSQHDFKEQKLLGDVKGKEVVIIDDQIATGGTLINMAKLIKEHGAKKVYAGVTHAMFLGEAGDKFAKAVEEGTFEEVIVTNTLIHTPEFLKKNKYLRVIDTLRIFSDAVFEMQVDGSVTRLYSDPLRKVMFGANHKPDP